MRTVAPSRGLVLVSDMIVLTPPGFALSLVYLGRKSTLPALVLLSALFSAFDPTCGMPGPTDGCSLCIATRAAAAGRTAIRAVNNAAIMPNASKHATALR